METNLENLLLQVSLSHTLDSGDLDQAEALLLTTCQSGLNVSRVGIWLLDQRADSMVCERLADSQDSTHPPMTLHRRDFPRYFEALDQQRTIPADHARSDPATAEFTDSYLIPLGITSMLDVPIRLDGRMAGIICCEHRGSPRVWQEQEKVFVASLADLYSRARIAEQKVCYQRQLEALNAKLEQDVMQRTQSLSEKVEQLNDARAKLVESEKMASLGGLVAGVAHEVNTPLGVAITACSHNMSLTNDITTAFEQGRLSKTALSDYLANLRESNNMLMRNLNRAATLISHFKQTAADQSNFELVEINLHDYISAVWVSLSPFTKKYKVNFELQCRNDLFLTTLPGALAQILTNLVVNSCKHGFHQAQQNHISITAESHPTQVHLRYKDNGVGMDEAVLSRAFEPFFTTRRQQGGTGLGLSIIYNLMKQTLQGDLHLRSKAGEGMTLDIYLPFDLKPLPPEPSP